MSLAHRFPKWFALLTMLVLAVATPRLFGDQACNTTYPDPPGTLGAGASGWGVGGSLGSASEAAFRDLTGYTEQCAKCNEEGEERCPGLPSVAMGADGAAFCHPIQVPYGWPPAWSCTFVIGADGGAWTYECFDC